MFSNAVHTNIEKLLSNTMETSHLFFLKSIVIIPKYKQNKLMMILK